MKIYFVASIKGKSRYFDNYKAIIKVLKNLGIDVICEDILESTEELVASIADERRVRHYKNVLKWINSSDIIVAEASYPSLGVGYEISLALEKGKPVIVLYTKEYVPHFIKGCESERLFLVKYDLQNLKQALKDVLDDAKNQIDLRFTMLLPPKIVNFLDQISKRKKIPKSVFIRDLIKERMGVEK